MEKRKQNIVYEPARVMSDRHKIDTKQLGDIAIYLTGLKDGKGNLLPLGTAHLEELWNAIKYLNGDLRFTSDLEK